MYCNVICWSLLDQHSTNIGPILNRLDNISTNKLDGQRFFNGLPLDSLQGASIDISIDMLVITQVSIETDISITCRSRVDQVAFVIRCHIGNALVDVH